MNKRNRNKNQNARKLKQTKLIRYREMAKKARTNVQNYSAADEEWYFMMDFAYIDNKLKFLANFFSFIIVVLTLPCLCYLVLIPEEWIDKIPFSLNFIVYGTLALSIAIIIFIASFSEAPNKFLKNIAWLKKGQIVCHDDLILLTLNGVEHKIKPTDILKLESNTYCNNRNGGLLIDGSYFRIVTKSHKYHINNSSNFDENYRDLYKIGYNIGEFYFPGLVEVPNSNIYESKKAFVITTIIALSLATITGIVSYDNNVEKISLILLVFLMFCSPYFTLVMIIMTEQTDTRMVYKRN